MTILADFPLDNGLVRERYSVVQDENDGIWIHCCLDAHRAGPIKTMHIDPAAAVRIAKALLVGVGRWATGHDAAPAPAANVVAFVPKIMAGVARSVDLGRAG
jgi:hypothetical protein